MTAPPLGSRTEVARNALHLVLGQGATTTLAVVFSAAIGRSLGAGDFGLYFIISSFSAFAYVVVGWGQNLYVVREVAKRPERCGKLLGSTLALRVAGAALICIPAALACRALGYDPRTRAFSLAFIAASLPFVLAQGYGFVFRGRDRMDLDATVSVINKAAVLAFALGALALGTGLSGVVVAQALAGVVALAVAARLYRRVGAGQVRFDWNTSREVLAGGGAIVAMMIAVSVQPYIDAVLLSKLVPTEAVGWFGAAKNIMGTLLAPSLILATAAYPRLSRAAPSVSTFKGEVRVALRPMLLLGALAAAGTYLFADDAISIVYGQRHFGPSGIILKVFAPGLFLLFIDVLFGNALTALGRVTAFSAAKVASIVLCTALDLFLIPWFQRRTGNGGIGVVLSFVVSEIVVFGGAVWLMPRGTMGGAVLVDVARALASGAVTVLLFLWLPALPVYVGVPACVIVFVLCALVMGLLRRSDVLLLQELIRGRTAAGMPPEEARDPGAQAA